MCLVKENPNVMITFLTLLMLPVRADLTSRIDALQDASYEAIKPTLYLQNDRNKLEMLGTRSENGLHVKEIVLSYTYAERDVIIDLKLSLDDFIPHDHFMRYQSPNGTDAIQYFTDELDKDFCHYKGTIRNIISSHAAISTCHGIKGVIFDGNETYYIDNRHSENITSDEHFLFRESDTLTSGFNEHHLLNDTKINTFRYKRLAVDSNIEEPSFVELVVVVDKAMYESLARNLTRVHIYCKDIVNVVNSVFVPLSIFIALIGVVVWNEQNEIEVSSNSNLTLDNFLEYRINNLSIKHPNDIAYLLTKQQFTDGVLGQSFGFSICSYSRSGGIVSVQNQIATVAGETFAHEMGHNFGMTHDTPDCKCKEKQCIMSTNASKLTLFHWAWSSCSLDELNVTFRRGMTQCLRNKPTQLFDPQISTCGNGFVEPGEQCDCGLPIFCKHSCCNPQNCQLHSNSSCATGECCDLSSCHLRNVGTICRRSTGECDLVEYCTGDTEYCPHNNFKRDTVLCGEGKAYCYNGTCQSHTDQCKLLWGNSGESIDECYSQNVNGSFWGNCGYNWLTNKFHKCSKKDIMCGTLQCLYSPNDTLELGHDSIAIEVYDEGDEDEVSCQQAFVGLQIVDPGLTSDGAKCGEGKMCLQQKCLSIESLRASGIGVACPENCNGHGVCNNQGECHCDVDYEQPFCSSKIYYSVSLSASVNDKIDALSCKVINLLWVLLLFFVI